MTPTMTLRTPQAAGQLNRHPWDAAAAGWDRHTALIHDWLLQATKSMLDDTCIGPGARVLDIAAGAGDQTLEIARRVGALGRVLATDISPELLARAHENAQAAGLTQVSTQWADAQSLGLAGAEFDAALCRLGLMFCRLPLAALTGTRAALRSGGRFSAMVFSEPRRNPCLAISLNTARKHAALAHFSAVESAAAYEPGTLMSLGKPGLLQELLQTAGFINVHVRRVPAPFHAPSVTHYVNFLRASALPVIEILAPLCAMAKEAAWADMTEQLSMFSSASGWVGPNELLLSIAVAP
jgi:ubiquinone/menaquinone biosynthesis C-methylase UbiE